MLRSSLHRAAQPEETVRSTGAPAQTRRRQPGHRQQHTKDCGYQAGQPTVRLPALANPSMRFEEPSESGVVGGPSAHQSYLQ